MPVALAPRRQAALAAVAAVLLAGAVAACGGSAHSTTSAQGSSSGGSKAGATGGGPANGSGGSAGRFAGSFPGALGSVASLSGSSMEVQNPQTGQVTVSWSSSTVFTETVTLSSSAVAVGDCVTATGKSSSGAITATSVSITKPVNGSCTGRGGFGGAPGGGGFGGNFPRPAGSSGHRIFGGTGSNGSTSRPSLPAGAADFGFASGKVTSVSGSKLVISGHAFTGGFRPRSSASSTTVPAATTVDVSVSSSTKYQETKSTTSSSLAVGDCVNAIGKAGSTGAVSASRISITSTGGQSCTGGFRGGFTGA